MTVLAIVGPTAAGKSAAAMELAERRGGVEIVAVDAFTVYRGMDIGTAKPSEEDRARVPHHCIDLLDPTEEVSVKWFREQARAAIDAILQRGGMPVLVGGSGLYFRAVVDDLSFPPTDSEVRARIRDRWRDDPPAGHAHLAELDPPAAAKIEPENLRRIVRALEVIELTGQRFSSYDDAWDDYTSVYPDLEVAYIEPPTAALRERIRARTEAMVAAGLLEEAAALPREELSRTARQGIGYAEAFAVLDGDLDRDDLVNEVEGRTWRYARRQRSWFRKDPRCTPTTPADILTTHAT